MRREDHHAVNVRRAAIGDEAILRDLRLQALADAPDAFGSTLERELARTVDDWRRWLSPGATFILEDRGMACGLVACAPEATDATVVDLMAMWVAPAARGSGAADALVAQVIAWARAGDARVVRLQVIGNNVRARRLYERHGFRVTGATRVRQRDGAVELEMELEQNRGTG
jgi:ribosomal protein S18 acetylase RimI-like enzyme